MHAKRMGAALIALAVSATLWVPSTLWATPALAAKKPQTAGKAQTAANAPDATKTKRVQQRLIDLGFLAGKADGVYGKDTQAAVKAFQAYANAQGYALAEDGVLGDATLGPLFDEALAARRWTLQKGDKGALVKKLQARLVELGYLSSATDGVFGADVARALNAFQEMLLGADIAGMEMGKADALTRSYLYERDLTGYDIRTPVFFDDTEPLALEDSYLYAGACMLIDAGTGEVLYARNERAQMYPASTTKLMTLMLGLTRGNFKQTVTVPEAAGKIPGGSSVVPVKPGEQMPYMDLLYGLMIPSGNDAANAIAVLTSGSIESFVAAMNKEAGELGMADTHFANAHGYHDEAHYTTAADMATLMRAVLRDEKAMTVLKARRYTMAATAQRKELPLSNTYQLLDAKSANHVPGAIGGKTGYTSKAGQCFVGVAERDGVTLIAVVLNSGDQSVNKWMDARRLFAYGFAKQGADKAA